MHAHKGCWGINASFPHKGMFVEGNVKKGGVAYYSCTSNGDINLHKSLRDVEVGVCRLYSGDWVV